MKFHYFVQRTKIKKTHYYFTRCGRTMESDEEGSFYAIDVCKSNNACLSCLNRIKEHHPALWERYMETDHAS